MFIRPRIIPVILIDEQDMIKTVNFKNPTYLGDPINAVKIFNRKGIDELAVLDIGATQKNREPDFDFLKDIASEAFMPISYGGGITTVNQMRKLFAIGYEKVLINTLLVKNTNIVKEAVALFGSQSIVASIDAQLVNGKYNAVIQAGNKPIQISPLELALKAEQLGVGEILINSIDRDGMMQGYDISLIKAISEAVKIPVIACGGAGNIKDLKQVLQEGHADAAAGGSMFVYYGKLKAVLITAPSENELINCEIYSKM